MAGYRQPPGEQVYYDSKTGKYVDQYGNPMQMQTKNATKSTDPKDRVYSPNVEGAYNYSQSALDKYFGSIKGFTPVGDLTQELKEVGAYQGYNWENPLDSYNAPTFANNVDLERTAFDVEDIQPISDEIYQNKISQGRKRVSKQFQDAKSQVLDEVYRNRNRPEQAAALLAEMGVQEAEVAQESEQNVLSEQAQQKLSTAENTRNLRLQAAGQQAQERMGYASFKQAQDQYAYEQTLADEQFRTGLGQWYQEQNAAEEQAKYQSKYAYAQDLGQARLNEYETNRAAEMDRYNAILQGQQAASQQFSQASTYYTNLTEDEREKAREYQSTKRSAYKTPNIQGSSYNVPNTNRRRVYG